MEESLVISPKESDFSLLKESQSRKELDPLASDQPTWSSRYRCFQAYVCFVMSYLSVLKFAERVGDYNATIFIPYLLCNVFIGVPAVLVEIMVGRFVMGNVSQAWNMCPPARGVFWCLFLVTCYGIVINYVYNIYLLKYFFASFFLRWDNCGESWNKINCYKIGRKSMAMAKCMKNNSEHFCHNLTWETSGTQYWKYIIESKENAVDIFLSFLFLAMNGLIIAAIIYKGIFTLQKMLSLLVYPSIVLWAIFVVVSFRASNSLNGFKRIFHFRWSHFIEPKMWVLAFEDTFYFLGLGKLTLTFISSHGKFTDNILIDVVIVIFGSITSCCLLTIPILSVIANTKYLDFGEAQEPFFSDMTDVFVSISEALLFYPNPPSLWSSIYYSDCILISLSSQALLVLALCEAIQEVFNIKEKSHFFYINIAVSLIFFTLAGGCQFIEFIREINHVTTVITTVMLSTITWQLIYGIRRFNYDYYFMMGYPVPLFLKFTWITLLIFPYVEMICKMYYRIPQRPLEEVVFIYFGIPVFIYVLVILIYVMKFSARKEKVSKVFRENPNWGPENALLKKSRQVFEQSSVTREFMYRQELYTKPHMKPPDFSTQNIVQLI